MKYQLTVSFIHPTPVDHVLYDWPPFPLKIAPSHGGLDPHL